MAPRNVEEVNDYEGDRLGLDQVDTMITDSPSQKRPPMKIVWRNVVLFIMLHLAAVYSLILVPKAMALTLVWSKSALMHISLLVSYVRRFKL